MFVSKESAGMGESWELASETPMIKIKSWEMLLKELRWLPQESHTWNYERREYIRRKISANELIQIYNILIQEVSNNSTISPNNKMLLLSLEQEWVTPEWVHYWLIEEVIWKIQTIQTQWISVHNSDLWQVTQQAGYRKLRTWKHNS